ncbi:MAG TPA: 2-oxo acid dehydrogenase subunit E2, partial [Gammaproteobacteria bacterium]|nr:2-oxo acid dehydrogenase subunit E2 [Gammaproteobacteria bacterium]
MLIEVKVPALAESVPDATLLDWYKQPGEAVARGENLIDLETDKVTLEIAAPDGGVIKELLHQSGDVVLPDVVLCIIDTEGVATSTNDKQTTAPPAAKVEEVPRFGPAVRRLIEEHAIDPSVIPASGKDGRLTKADILGYLEAGQSDGAEAKPASTAQQQLQVPPTARPEERVPMTRLRKRTAERLLQAQQQNALLTTFNEVNMRPFMDLRARHKEEFEKQYGVRLGFMSVFVKAAVEALQKFPIV